MEYEYTTVDIILKIFDAFLSLGVLATFVLMFMQGKIVSKTVVDEERDRDKAYDEKIEDLHQQIIDGQRLRLASLEAQLSEKTQQVSASLTLMRAFQGTQDQAARTAKALLGGSDGA